MVIQQVLIPEIEKELKSRNLEVDQIMQQVVFYLMGDMGIFVELERFYNLRKVQNNVDQALDMAKVKLFIEKSLEISEKILDNKVNQRAIMMFPHLLSDYLFNETGYESEEIVNFISRLNADKKVPEDLIKLIIQEAYSVEKSKESCFKAFDQQMAEMEKMMSQQGGPGGPGGMPPGMLPPGMSPDQLPPGFGQGGPNDPLNDPALRQMLEMGMLGGPGGPGGMPPAPGGMPGLDGPGTF